MRFSETKKHKVVSSSTAEQVGRLSSFVVDPATRAVLALRLKKTDGGDLLRWSDVTGFGPDAVTVADADVFLDARDADDQLAFRADKKRRVLKKRVLTDGGDQIGEISDVDFDPETGLLRTLVLTGGTVAEVGAERLLGIGSYAVVVRGTV